MVSFVDTNTPITAIEAAGKEERKFGRIDEQNTNGSFVERD